MLIVEVNDLNVINNLNADGFLIGTEFISSECFMHFSIEQILEFVRKVHQLNKKVFLDATQIFHDQDLKKVKDILDKLDQVDYVLYNDLALMSLINKEKRFYYSTTYITNKYDFEIVSKENKYVLVSPTLSYEELQTFKMMDNSFLIGFGTYEIFHSRRPLITNYIEYRKMKHDNSDYKIIEEFRNELYPIIENNGTKIYLNDVFYLGKELVNLNNNLILKVFDLPLDITNNVIDLYRQAFEKDDFSILESLKELPIKLHKGLLYENSVLIKEVKVNG